MAESLRAVVFTDVSSPFGVPHVYELLDTPACDLAALVLAPPRASDPGAMPLCDRWGARRVRDLARTAEERAIPVLRPAALGDDGFLSALRVLSPDLVVSAGFRRLIPTPVLETARLAAVNFHPSLLPRMRGADPCFWAVLEGDAQAGATVHHLTDRLDAGDLILQTTVPIDPDETGSTLRQKTLVESLRLVAPLLAGVRAGTLPRTPQDETRASRNPWTTDEHARIVWSEPPERTCNRVRACRSTPGAHTRFQGRRVEVLEAEIATDPRVCAIDASPGDVVAVGAHGVVVQAGGGHVVLRTVEFDKEAWNAARFVSLARCGTCPSRFD